jgi:hypothetical protein
MITDQQEAAIAAARAKSAQDKNVPLLISVKDAWLIPNTELTRKAEDFVEYHGDPKATLEERKQYIATLGRAGKRRVIVTPDKPFEIAKASREELVTFAFNEYGATLNPEAHLASLRAEVRKLAVAHGAAAPEEALG